MPFTPTRENNNDSVLTWYNAATGTFTLYRVTSADLAKISPLTEISQETVWPGALEVRVIATTSQPLAQTANPPPK